jgi:hypothetical protein
MFSRYRANRQARKAADALNKVIKLQDKIIDGEDSSVFATIYEEKNPYPASAFMKDSGKCQRSCDRFFRAIDLMRLSEYSEINKQADQLLKLYDRHNARYKRETTIGIQQRAEITSERLRKSFQRLGRSLVSGHTA